MSRVAKGTEIGVVRCHDDSKATGGQQAVKLFHGSHHVANVFDHVNGPHLAKRAVGEGKGILIEIGDHIGASVRVAIDANCPGIFVDPAPNIQYGERPS